MSISTIFQSDLNSNNLSSAKTDFNNFLMDLQAKGQFYHHRVKI